MHRQFKISGLVLALVVGGMVGSVSAEETKVTREQYTADLAEYTGREVQAQADIKTLDESIASLTSQIDEVQVIIDRINETRPDHIITLEDPIEFLHTNKKSIVTQREIAIDTKSFDIALRAALREDPDVILIGEMRDAETFAAAASAAETGHLVFSTLHTTNAMLTIERILDMFPPTQHDQIRSQMSMQLKACIAQRLLPTKDGKGRIAAIEIMFNTPAIAQLIRDNNIKSIGSAIAAGAEEGMQSFNVSLVKLTNDKKVKVEDAMKASDNSDELKMNLEGIYLSATAGILKR